MNVIFKRSLIYVTPLRYRFNAVPNFTRGVFLKEILYTCTKLHTHIHDNIMITKIVVPLQQCGNKLEDDGLQEVVVVVQKNWALGIKFY